MAKRTLKLKIDRVQQDNQAIVGQDLITTTANVIGTAYKGTAFVPKKIVSSFAINDSQEDPDIDLIYNTQFNTLGSSRQNRFEHLYDDYSCNVDSNGYDAISIWMENGGQQSTFTRVLGIGTGVKDTNTGKMQNSGFNVANNISSGTLSQTVNSNLNAITNGVAGNTSFIFKTINEISKASSDVDTSDVTKVDYLDELFCNIKTQAEQTELNILTDVMIFASGVLPDLTAQDIADESKFFEYSSVASTYNITKQVSNKNQNFIKLSGFKPYNIPSENKDKPFSYAQDDYLDQANFIEKQDKYSNSDKNYFSSRMLDKGYFTYATFPFGGINDKFTNHKRFTVLTAKPHSIITAALPEGQKNVPDYNSFESEYTTAKTPWITSQPIDRSTFGSSATDNRQSIHDKVQDLFRFYSLDDGDIGNKIRIKINPTRRGTTKIETNFMSDEEFATFDVYIFIYEPRNNSYVNIETYRDVNLHPDSPNYIASKIGDVYEYYDFNLNRVAQKGFFRNKSQYVRVEVKEAIDEKRFKNQHELIPSGFRSYPYIEFTKNAFKSFWNDDGQLDTLFDTQGVYQLPPLYVLNKYEEYNTDHLVENITNHWGVVFNRSKIVKDRLVPNSLVSYSDAVSREISPHFYYTKYFLNGIEGSHSYKNIWKENDNYLNSFFHLEKILVKTSTENVKELDRYKHSGRVPSNTTNYKYLNISDDSLWEHDRELRSLYRDKLSFDLFTYGGFDGVDIRDNDKRFLKNDAILRELTDSNDNNCTYTSYDKAIDIATDDETCAGDILIVPGIKEIPVVNKCVQKCEEDRRHFYLADISGAASSSNIVYYTDTRTGKNNKQLISSKGTTGQYFLVENNLENYFLNRSEITSTDKRFILKDENDPNQGDNIKYYDYKTVLENNFDTIKAMWLSEDIRSRYLFASYGDLTSTLGASSERQISSDVFVLGKMAQLSSPNSNIIGQSTLSFHGVGTNFDLILQTRLNYNSELFEDDLAEFRKSSSNLIYTPKRESPQLITQLTSHENRKEIFQEQKYVRTIQEIKKIIKYDIFINDSFINGGVLFSQNSNLENLYQKLDIQLNLLMQNLVQSGLIIGYKVRIQNFQDDKTILDMQNYIIRGNIVLQFTESDIINLQLDEVLSDLSLLANPGQDTVYIPRSKF